MRRGNAVQTFDENSAKGDMGKDWRVWEICSAIIEQMLLEEKKILHEKNEFS